MFKEESESEEESEDKQSSKSKYDLLLTDDKVQKGHCCVYLGVR